jgi:hypothetical protein
MAERLVPLPATQVALVRSPVPARPTISVEKLALFCNPASGGTLQALQLHYIVGYKNCSSQGLWRLWGRLDCCWRPGPESDSEAKTDESNGVPASCGLGPHRNFYGQYMKIKSYWNIQRREREKRGKEQIFNLPYFPNL